MDRASPKRGILPQLPIATLWLCLLAFLAGPALGFGLLQPAETPLQATLSRPGAVINGYELNRAELQILYAQRGYAPAWDTSPQGQRAALSAFIDSMIAFADYHGLPSNNGQPAAHMRALVASATESDALKLELLVTDWLLKLAHDLSGNRVNLALLYPGWEFAKEKRDIPTELGQAIAQNKVQEYLTSLAPQELNYKRLADTLKTYRDIAANGPWPTVPTGPTLKPGQRDARVLQVRARLEAELYVIPPTADPALYDDSLRDVVIAYQSRNGLESDGNIGAKTLSAMNVPISRRIQQIAANMERARHMPEIRDERYAIVNSADASIKVVEQGETTYHAVVIVGRPDRKTPFIKSAIRSIIFNPAWNVPAKIAREDILPKLRKDPHYLEKMGFVISGSADDPHGTNIDWNTIKKSEFNFRLRQAPGDLNSLGQLKFDFDNDFAVYLHDTSHPELFAKPDRHLSSGCVRIKDPELFAQIILARNEGAWTQESIHQEIDKKKTRWLKVDEPLPLYIVYETVFFPTPESQVHFRGDTYNYDNFLISMMNGEKAKRLSN